MKLIIFAFTLAGACLAADPPKPVAPPVQQEGLTELEASRLDAFQTRRDLLTTQMTLLSTQVTEYQNAVKAAHPSLKIHLDQTLHWVLDAEPQPQPKPEESKPAAAPMKKAVPPTKEKETPSK